MDSLQHERGQPVGGYVQNRDLGIPATIPRAWPSLNGLRVAMLVANPCTTDSRVIKEAQALAAAGCEVAVICRAAADLPEYEIKQGVQYIRVTPPKQTLYDIWLRLWGSDKRGSATVERARMGPISHLKQRHKELVPDSGGVTQSSPAYFRTIVEFGKNCVYFIYSYLNICARFLKNVGKNQKYLYLMCKNLNKYGGHSSDNTKKYIIKIYNYFNKYVRILRNYAKKYALRFKKILKKPILFVAYYVFDVDQFGRAAAAPLRDFRPYVIHAHDLATLPVAGRLAAELDTYLLYDSHELEMHRNANYPWFVQRRRQRLESTYIKRTDAVITVSDSISDHLSAVYAIPRPCVVMNSPTLTEMNTTSRQLRKELGLESDTPLAVYLGSVTFNRGLEKAALALCHAEELHMAFVGPRRAETEREIKHIAEVHNLEDRIHLVDPVPSDQVVNYVHSADVSVMPIQNVCLSYYYCMPNKLLESVFAGIPVAVADLYELRRFVELYGCGEVMDETDPEDIARAVMNLARNRMRYVLPLHKRNELVEIYGWGTQAMKLRTLYEELTSTGDVGPESVTPPATVAHT